MYVFNPEKYWYLSLINLGAFYLLLVLLGFLIFWIYTKPVFSLLSVVSILICWTPVQHLFQLRFSGFLPLQKENGNVRIMSWNVEHFEIGNKKQGIKNKTEMLNLIRNYNPDIAFFQEMVGSDYHSTAQNYIPDFKDTLHFKDYHFTYNSKLDYDNEHHFGLIIFSKYPIINKQDVSYPPHDYNSTFQYADILLNKDTVRVFNIHLQSLKFDKDNRNYLEQPGISGEKNIQNSRSIIVKLKKGYLLRAIQSNRIKEAIEKSPYPVIVCGDFNDVPNSYAYYTIGKNLHNVFYEKGSGTGRTFSGISPTLRIDHIFVDQQFKVNHFLRISKKLSDHYPLIADIEFRQ